MTGGNITQVVEHRKHWSASASCRNKMDLDGEDGIVQNEQNVLKSYANSEEITPVNAVKDTWTRRNVDRVQQLICSL